MRNLNELNAYRVTDRQVTAMYGLLGDGSCGAFRIPSPIDGQPLLVIASSGGGWDHVSVSRRNRVPNQAELSHIHRTFFGPTETAVQYFLPAAEHINVHPHTLHLWRPRADNLALPRPPAEFV